LPIFRLLTFDSRFSIADFSIVDFSIADFRLLIFDC